MGCARQEDEKHVDDEKHNDADRKQPVGVDRLAEGLGDRESHAGNEILEVSDHVEHSALVRVVRAVEGERLGVKRHVEGLLSHVEEEENLERKLDGARNDDRGQHREVEKRSSWHILGQFVIGSSPSLDH